jgi:hypothetical protein
MINKFKTVIKHVIGSDACDNPLSGINIPDQFHPEKPDNINVEENLNASFLILLAGESHSLYENAARYFTKMESMPEWKETVVFYRKGLERIASEISSTYNSDTYFKSSIDDLYTWIDDRANKANQHESVKKMWQIFFPEGTGLRSNPDSNITNLRNKRIVNITSLNRSPISDPVKQMVFTSNILITTPIGDIDENNPTISNTLAQKLKSIINEDQLFWYDHPIPIGIAAESNEILYGLEGLDRAVAFEKEQGTIDKGSKLTCLLSVSVTHKGLQQIAKQYLEDELNNEKNIRHLEVYVFTESDTQLIIENILIPAAERFIDKINPDILRDVFGVDGEYGRHYSFLKAIAAFWQVFINPEIQGTFKIDLDQIFPQEKLVEQSGLSAFEHFKTPLWGAKGTDSNGNPVELGMIAGALVNQNDIDHSLFFPDVSFPSNEIKADELVFYSTLPQALSTEAEMMTRYTDKQPDGKSQCIQRIHVTGGTNGILLDALRRHRPFTPSIIGRAEDQAYILSVLFNDSPFKLRYVHKDGLIMSHDKEAFAVEAIKKAATGKIIGDYIRILLFSYYSKALLWPLDKIKKQADPFTGCFISKIPFTIVYLRFALKTASFFADKSDDRRQQGKELMESGVKRLGETMSYLNKNPNPLVELYKKEKSGWNMFYDILDKAESSIINEDAFAFELRNKASSIIKSCKISFQV